MGDGSSLSLISSVSAGNRIRRIAINGLDFRQRYPSGSRRQNGHTASPWERETLKATLHFSRVLPWRLVCAGTRQGSRPSVPRLPGSQACLKRSRRPNCHRRKTRQDRRLAKFLTGCPLDWHSARPLLRQNHRRVLSFMLPRSLEPGPRQVRAT